MKDLKITVIQTDIIWHDIEENLDHIESLIKQNNEETDLLLLPEMFSTGFTMEPEINAEDMDSYSVRFLKRISGELDADIAGTIAVYENGKYYNRLIWAKPDGTIHTYDKKHLFRMGGEEKIYEPGSSLLTVELHGWKIRPFICYDMRFPAWCRNTDLEYDIAIYTANWPESRDSHWDMLLRARAIENQCYVIGVNRTGTDGNGISYSGRSAAIDYFGDIINRTNREEALFTVDLYYDEMKEYRESFPAWMDADKFTIA